MWCISGSSIDGIELTDYDTNETVLTTVEHFHSYNPLGLYTKAGSSTQWVTIPKYCYKLLDYVDVVKRKQKLTLAEVKEEGVFFKVNEARFIRRLDTYGIVWTDGSMRYNLLEFLFELEDRFDIDVTDYKKLVIYFPKRTCKYIISFEDGFKKFFSKIRFVTENGTKGIF